MDRLGLKGKEKRIPSEISGGEQQQVAIVVTLASERKFLLADDSTD